MNKLKALNKSPIIAAAFLMATSAIGPGFLTQTAVFTNQLFASFGFIILISILLDIGAQLNIWRILSVSGLRAQEVANKVIPGAGYVLTFLIVIGGLAFNIGNLAGTGLGLNVLTGISPEKGAAISAFIAIGIFIVKDALKWMDGFAKFLGIVMLVLTLYVVFSSRPPITEAVQKTFWPDKIDMKAILTLVGGTVGGYISFAGAHRLLDAGLKGEAALPQVNQSAISGILLASVMRILLFLAALGVVTKGLPLLPNNPAASVFQFAAGQAGYKIFGIVMWSAAITSVIGSAYTSVSFLKTFHPSLANRQKPLIIVFILVSAIVFILNGQPVQTLVFVGTLNGFILPFSLGIILMAAYRKQIVQAYHHPWWMTVFGGLVVIATLWMSIATAAKYVMGN
jgi:Mn2+/Fe2+ NRAMP family transporter